MRYALPFSDQQQGRKIESELETLPAAWIDYSITRGEIGGAWIDLSAFSFLTLTQNMENG